LTAGGVDETLGLGNKVLVYGPPAPACYAVDSRENKKLTEKERAGGWRSHLFLLYFYLIT